MSMCAITLSGSLTTGPSLRPPPADLAVDDFPAAFAIISCIGSSQQRRGRRKKFTLDLPEAVSLGGEHTAHACSAGRAGGSQHSSEDFFAVLNFQFSFAPLILLPSSLLFRRQGP